MIFLVWAGISMILSASVQKNAQPYHLFMHYIDFVQVETPIGISTKTDCNWILYWHESSRYSKSSH